MLAEEFVKNMTLDKKVSAGQLRLILMQGIGKSVLTADYPEDALHDTIRAYCGNAE